MLIVIIKMENSIAQSSSSGDDPATPLRQREDKDSLRPVQGAARSLRVRYCRTRKCITSKAAIIILLWSLAVSLVYSIGFNPDIYVQVFSFNSIWGGLIPYVVVPIILCFFPLAGFLADTKFGRYKTVTVSLYIIMPPMVLLVVAEAFMIPYMISNEFVTLVVLLVFYVLAGILVLAVLVMIVGFVGFTANVIQFGMDQLYDSPGEDQSLFIHWFMWLYYISVFLSQLGWNFIEISSSFIRADKPHVYGAVLLLLIPLLVTVLLIVTLCVAHRRRRWFLIEPGRVNPYKLVSRVTKFASQHKIPVRRSAFTYCEDELPSGLDLGKNKYGGPFTTEEVEDVKAFYGILKVLFSFGTVFFLDFIANSMLPVFAKHDIPYYGHYYELFDNSSFFSFSGYNETLGHSILIANGLLTPLLIVVCIPLYLCLIRPFMSRYVPGMLKRMGLGMLLVLLSLIATFVMDTVAHIRNKEALCMFSDLFSFDHLPDPSSTDFLNTAYLIVQHTLSALSNMLIYIGVFEFICSQSPTSMKGLLIGLVYAIKGLFQLIAAAVTVPFYVPWNGKSTFPSCGFYFYLMGLVVGVPSLLVYVWVARKYKNRVRDEPSHIRQYAEEYYSNPQQEENYDYHSF